MNNIPKYAIICWDMTVSDWILKRVTFCPNTKTDVIKAPHTMISTISPYPSRPIKGITKMGTKKVDTLRRTVKIKIKTIKIY
jgi:hypothetical protein